MTTYYSTRHSFPTSLPSFYTRFHQKHEDPSQNEAIMYQVLGKNILSMLVSFVIHLIYIIILTYQGKKFIHHIIFLTRLLNVM